VEIAWERFLENALPLARKIREWLKNNLYQFQLRSV
jgi:hypothetical protein